MKYSYVFIIALILFIGTSFGLTFFVQNMNIASGSLTTAPLNITLTDNSISANGLTKPTTNQEGIDEYVKELTITNNTTTDGKVKLTLERTSGLNLTDMSYTDNRGGAALRPIITLKPGLTIASGNGSSGSHYTLNAS